MKNLLIVTMLGLGSFAVGASSAAEKMEISLNNVETGKSIGQIEVTVAEQGGLVFTPKLSGLSAGLHGFHIHEKPSCDAATQDGEKVLAGAAGSHFDPDETKQHSFPWSEEGHAGDLPALYVADDGTATHPVYAPLLDIEDIRGHAIMIHAKGDNYADSPEKLGGGGSRVACGVIPESDESLPLLNNLG
ncbi:superoxide dismutase family protein [Neptunicella sp. SCSIO 80796]|uniref:superoxide dismutase family protein n=1 Tax=Neptunicella plasticusilytica TaxID=3117012 RepID=UPI003A4D2388